MLFLKYERVIGKYGYIEYFFFKLREIFMKIFK